LTKSGTSSPIDFADRLEKVEGEGFGENASFLIAASTLACVAFFTFPLLFITRETVAIDTPASLATS